MCEGCDLCLKGRFHKQQKSLDCMNFHSGCMALFCKDRVGFALIPYDARENGID